MAGAGLQVLRRHHVVHRDLKPQVQSRDWSISFSAFHNWWDGSAVVVTDVTISLRCCRISYCLRQAAMRSSRYLISALQGAALPPSRFQILPCELKLVKCSSWISVTLWHAGFLVLGSMQTLLAVPVCTWPRKWCCFKSTMTRYARISVICLYMKWVYDEKIWTSVVLR
jgi:hypothetical protein